MARNGHARLKRVKDSMLTGSASVGAKVSVDGKRHTGLTDSVLKFSVKVLDRPEGWDDDAYDSYLYGEDLKARVKVKNASKLLKVIVLTEEQKEQNKHDRGLKRDEEGFAAQVARMAPEEIREAMEALLPPDERAALEEGRRLADEESRLDHEDYQDEDDDN